MISAKVEPNQPLKQQRRFVAQTVAAITCCWTMRLEAPDPSPLNW